MFNRMSIRQLQVPFRFFILTVLLALLMLLGAFTSAASAMPSGVAGDSTITSADLINVMQYLEGQISLDAAALLRADMNHDGKVDAADIIAIRNALFATTITINATPDTGQWTLTGPLGFAGNRQTYTGDQTFLNSPPGPYTLACQDNITSSDPPASQTQILAPGGTLSFSPVWIPEEDSGHLPVVMLPVPAGTFTMGARDDETSNTDEGPRHQVTLSAYQIGKFTVTNGQYCDALNWALARGYIHGAWSGDPYTGGVPYAAGQALVYLDRASCNIQYTSGSFSPKTRASTSSVQCSMATHPVVQVTWFGSVVFCNWLSEKEGFSAAYNTTSWKLIDADSGKSGTQFTNGYRLPTEAEWERAAGWNGTTHWIYGFQSDTLTGKDRCNYRDDTLAYINPLGLVEFPYTSPVGWFNGLNTSPNGLVQTINSPSPVGAYDMTGNVYEWCHDWYGAYSSASKTNPIGPGSSPSGSRVNRGGSWLGFSACCRSAYRNCHDPRITFDCYGFRVVRSTSAP